MYFKRIRELREDNDLTQKQVAQKLQLHTTTYQRWERGEREVPASTVLKLSKLYGVSADYILQTHGTN